MSEIQREKIRFIEDFARVKYSGKESYRDAKKFIDTYYQEALDIYDIYRQSMLI